jgi:hypothetical protein
MLDECFSDLEDVLSESDDEFIPQGDASESKDNLEVNSEENDIACATTDVDSDEDNEFIAKSGKMWKSSVHPLTRSRQCNIVTDLLGQRAQLMLQPKCMKFSTCFLMTKL